MSNIMSCVMPPFNLDADSPPDFITFRVGQSNQQKQPRITSAGSSIVSQRRLLRIMSLGQGDLRGTWGITMVQTNYSKTQQQILDAVACINDAVRRDLGATRSYLERKGAVLVHGNANRRNQKGRAPGGNRVTDGDELYAKYSQEWIANARSLDRASVDAIRAEFQSWITAMEGNCRGGDMRYVFCLLLDETTIERLSAMWHSQPIHRGAWDKQAQVKIKVLDAMPGMGCSGVYEMHLGGEKGLVDFWFERNLRRQPLETFLTQPEREVRCGATGRGGRARWWER